VPTIYHRARFERVGTLRFAHPAIFCERASDVQLRQINTTGKSLRIIRNRVKPWNQKYCAFVLTQISRITPPVSRRMRGARDRHERAVRCDGRGWRARRTRRTRTVKSCGSGAAVLALSCAGFISCAATEAKEPFSGESTK
jgi:hypothetical protein